jgi:hypothetical protein
MTVIGRLPVVIVSMEAKVVPSARAHVNEPLIGARSATTGVGVKVGKKCGTPPLELPATAHGLT